MPFKTEDVAYLAGLYEGEGYCHVNRSFWTRAGEKRPRVTPQVKLRIGMTDREPLERVRDTIGGRINGPYLYKQKGPVRMLKPMWVLDIDSPPLVREVIAAIWPLLSPRRQAQLALLTGEKAA